MVAGPGATDDAARGRPLPDRIRQVRLDSGIRVVTECMPDAHSVTTGFWVDAGSRAERAPRSETGPPVGAGARPSAVPPDLQQLFIMFTSSALINMGEAADPGSGERHVDLDQAREAIDVLVLLRDKTQGNRSEEESRLLEDVLYDLQMRFVRVARGSRP